MMDQALQAFLTILHSEGQANDASHQERRERMLNLEPETARLLSMLVLSSKRKHILEIGTSNGYSTIWLAWAVQQTGGHVISIDRDEAKHVLADKNLRQAGLREFVDLESGDGIEIVANLSGPFDCVFFDADRLSAPEQLDLLLPKLTSDVLLLCDNALSHPEEAARYLRTVEALADFQHMIVPVGKGLSVAYRFSKN